MSDPQQAASPPDPDDPDTADLAEDRDEPPPPAPFVVTKEHRRFTEFADACRRHRYIGLCYGPPGVGKTLSARTYACWDEVSHRILRWMANLTMGRNHPEWHTVLYTPTVNATPRIIDKELRELSERLAGIRSETLKDRRIRSDPHGSSPFTELLIVDEADRLKVPALEQLRDHYDRSHLGLILIGMPGIEKRLARYPSSTAASASSTITGRCPPASKPSSSPGTGPTCTSTTPTTTPPRRPSRPSTASPAGTSASPAASSLRSNASWRSTSSDRH